jgi:hypothetical protein
MLNRGEIKVSTFQPSRWDWWPCASIPALKRRAIFGLSLRDEAARARKVPLPQKKNGTACAVPFVNFNPPQSIHGTMIVAGWLHGPLLAAFDALARTRCQTRVPLGCPVNVVLLAPEVLTCCQLVSTDGSVVQR